MKHLQNESKQQMPTTQALPVNVNSRRAPCAQRPPGLEAIEPGRTPCSHCYNLQRPDSRGATDGAEPIQAQPIFG